MSGEQWSPFFSSPKIWHLIAGEDERCICAVHCCTTSEASLQCPNLRVHWLVEISKFISAFSLVTMKMQKDGREMLAFAPAVLCHAFQMSEISSTRSYRRVQRRLFLCDTFPRAGHHTRQQEIQPSARGARPRHVRSLELECTVGYSHRSRVY